MRMKICKGCGRELEETRFYRLKKMKDGRQAKCMDCVKALNLARYYQKKRAKEWGPFPDHG